MSEILRFGTAALPAEPPTAPAVWSVRGLAGRAPVLDAEERRRAAGFRRAEDRETYEAAHTALRVLTGAYLGEDPAAVRFVREPCPGCGGPHGRPALAHGPLHFSLSHTRGLALLAFALAPVGIDVELLPDEALVTDAAAALHPDEQRELRQLPAPGRPLAFARCWTRKEAYLKGTGEGIADGGLARTLMGTGPRPLPVEGWTVMDLAARTGCAAALAVAEPSVEPPKPTQEEP
ncbi:4'-phosphopantetheinyl transferase family protein [Streptomyces sp. NPDC050418]|uniref:4'-phosphopantetheinyl transferase family protein n=1 Tax=Streptomyces sp. NPDC050418 TaxID=3365612 RepID=UPI00379EC4AD